jgi:peptidoglycan/xylan/chitin deacetylase (PgdA/CDA1 family)
MDFFKMRKNLLIFGFVGLGLISLLFFTIPPNSTDNEKKGVLTLTFDDGLKSQYEIAFKEMQKQGYKGTLFIVANWTGLFEGRELMSFDDAKEMQENNWEIGSHSLSHNFQNRLTKISDEELKNELSKSKEILEKEGFKIQTFASPFGDYNNKVKEETKNYYISVRSLEWGYSSFVNLDFYNLKSKWVTTKHSSEEVCGWIKKANNENLWLILNFHHIGEEKTPWDFSEQKFKEVLECINNEDIQVKTIMGVLEYEERN